MIRITWLVGVTLAFALIAGNESRVSAGGKSDSKVKASAIATNPDAEGLQKVTITLDIEKSWYLYANPVDSTPFAQNRTLVSIKAKGAVRADVKYPVGKLKEEDGEKYRIYQNRIVIEASLQRQKGDVSPLALSIKVNACRINAKGETAECLLPGTIELTVK